MYFVVVVVVSLLWIDLSLLKSVVRRLETKGKRVKAVYLKSEEKKFKPNTKAIKSVYLPPASL